MNSSSEFDKGEKKKKSNKEKPIWNNPEPADVFFPPLFVGSVCKPNSDNLQI